MKTLILRKMGCNFWRDSDWNTSDCGNYRLRAEFTDKDGKKVCADFFPDGTMGARWMRISASWFDKFTWAYDPLDYADLYGIDGKHLRYRLDDILRAVNSVSAEQYDDIQLVD